MKIFEFSFLGIQFAPSYYGLMYVLAFLYGIWYIKKYSNFTQKEQESLFVYIFLGVILGGRIGYILFYNFGGFLADPWSLFRIWEGGMSFHGGFLGVLCASYLFSNRYKTSFWSLSDLLAKIAPVGLFFGRIGNYLNKELLGFPYTGPFAVVNETGSYFPSPLLEAFLEGIVLWILLNLVHRASFPGKLSALFLIYYGVFRCLIELFVRSPDAQIGYYFGFFTQGFFLSIPMILLGIILYYFLKNNKHAHV